MTQELMNLPHRAVRMGSSDARVERRADGSMIIELTEQLGPYPGRLTECLIHWAEKTPERTFLARRPASGEGWQRLSYAEAYRQVRALGQALLDQGLSIDRPVMILSDKSFEHAILAMAALHVGVPYIPVTPAYALLATDYVKLRHLQELCRPGLVFADNGELYEEAVTSVFPDATFAVTESPPKAIPATLFSELAATVPSDDVERAFAAIGPDTIGKIMFTSGTTGAPKGVIYSQRMLCSNRQQVAQCIAFLQDEPPLLVDWLPWHHTFGGTNNFGAVLYGGGTYYMDPGKPTAAEIGPTVEALRELAPNIYINTPQGFSTLLPHLRKDKALRENFFSRLKLIYYGGAMLPVHIWEGLDELAVQTIGERVLILSGLGSTETGPTPANSTWDPRREAIVGLPLPGVKIKLAPAENKLEIRYKGPCVSPGYWKDPERTRATIDEEGFFRSGDAVTLIDPAHPEKGMKFDGRLSENFKLLSGTFVSVAEVRQRALDAFAPCASEAVIAGQNREYVAALVFPDIEACRELCRELPMDAGAGEIVASPGVRQYFQRALDKHVSETTGSSRQIVRIVLESSPPTLDSGELTAKSAVSQATVLARRPDRVAALYEENPSCQIIVANTAKTRP